MPQTHLIPMEQISEAEMLVEFASEKGINIGQGTLSGIIKAKHASKQTNLWTQQVETEFWHAYNQIAKAVLPSSTSSVKAISKPRHARPSYIRRLLGGNVPSVADKNLSWYRILTFGFLVLVVATQIIWTYGTTVVNDINDLSQKVIKNNEQILALDAADTGKEDFDDKISYIEQTNEKYLTKLETCYRKLAWLSITFSTRHESAEYERIYESIGNKQLTEADNTRLMTAMQNTEFAMFIIKLYILPLLYGFLGSCVYILRSLVREINDVTFTAESRSIYMSRLLLGGLAGLSIGWFTTPEKTEALKSVSPFAFAFIAGYSIELLYSFLDKTLSSFSAVSSKNKA